MGASSSTSESGPLIDFSTDSLSTPPTEDPSLALLSSTVLIDAGQAPAGYNNDGPPGGGVLTLWKPVVSEELIKADGDQGIYISASASFNLTPKIGDEKKKKCRCSCCRRRKDRMNEGAESCGDYAATETEVITLRSAEDIVIIPSEVFPLEMVANLDLTASEVRVKPVKKRRRQVPIKPDKPMGLWGLIKSAIGKDISKLPLPVNFAEPLSMLQRLAEDYEYSQILDKASKMTDSLEQLASVAAFTVSSYATCAVRTAKPFNPLLGETFEFDRTDDMGWRCIAEQVCHHPPIAALHCDSAMGWVQWQQFTMKSNFRGTYLELIPLGIAHLRFKTSDNHYTWRKVNTVVRNLYIGKIYIEQDGEMDIINHTTNEKCHMKYSSGGVFGRDRSVSGKVYGADNKPKFELTGAWDSELRVVRLDDRGKPMEEPRLIWQKNSLPPDAENRYFFSLFACQLNEPEDGVAPTDSRNRPDQRFMENGYWDEANAEKQRLEEKQREARKQRLLDGTTKHSTSSKINPKNKSGGNLPEEGVEPYYTPSWFTRQKDPMSGQVIHMFNGEYWDCKQNQDWSRCPRIFDK